MKKGEKEKMELHQIDNFIAAALISISQMRQKKE